MTTLTGRALMRAKEEYASAVVESMSHHKALSYLHQIIYNDVSVLGGEDLEKKIRRQFGDDFYDDMVREITKNQDGSTHQRRDLDSLS